MKELNCCICELRCRLAEGRTGACGLYELRDSQIVERFADRYLVACPISIETMPMLHFHPGAKFFQISTTGCNLNCPGCISTVLVREMFHDSRILQYLSAEQIIAQTLENRCEGIVFLMNDPLAAFPRFLKIAQLAHTKGLKIGCSSNAYFTVESLTQLLPYLDFINIGMKGFSDKAYRACGVPEIRPVLRNMKALHEAGVHIEISCILTRENQSELMDLAHYISGISQRIPLQVMRFLPFETASIAQEPSIREAEGFCKNLRQTLDFVYLFNTPGSEHLHTRCPRCGRLVLRRDFYGPMGAKIRLPESLGLQDARCPACAEELPIVGLTAQSGYQEGDFEGGYPFTRALEIVEAMLIAMGVTRKEAVVRAWEDLFQNGGLKKLHQSIQHPRTYIEAVRHFGEKAGVVDRAEALAHHLEDRLAPIEAAAALAARRPRVYYAMGKPLFYINGARLENQLVETAGGVSVNRELPPGGRPGRTLTVSQLNRLNPEVIFISAFISNSVDDFLSECLELGVEVDAVQQRQIFVHPAPGWDFGSPRWILGLMHIASILHPNRCSYDVIAEAQAFYQRFYGMDFSPQDVNRSFAKPSDNWTWQDRKES
ncbi:MAG: radical SAM protein [Desulfobacterales bacterium]|jgi:pyruvate-formate lyase-activating enzyme|nr:radical SAM protein [Desulfobacterales bacterium]MDD4463008.1 radical SAM protein [Desulfobacterales bacterium]MDY0377869.1 radical SAM protein [Desulfobacterales bacterium]